MMENLTDDVYDAALRIIEEASVHAVMCVEEASVCGGG
jgi:hypothetical protein